MNIEMNYFNGTEYVVLYPKVGLNVWKTSLIENGNRLQLIKNDTTNNVKYYKIVEIPIQPFLYFGNLLIRYISNDYASNGPYFGKMDYIQFISATEGSGYTFVSDGAYTIYKRNFNIINNSLCILVFNESKYRNTFLQFGTPFDDENQKYDLWFIY